MSTRLGVLVLAGLAVGGCGREAEDVESSVPGGPLALAGGPAEPLPDRLVAALSPDDAWRVTPGTGGLVEGPGGPVLEIARGRSARIEIPGPFDTSACNRLEVTVSAPAGFCDVRATLEGGGRTVARTARTRVARGGSEPAVLGFALERKAPGPANRLVLWLDKMRGPWRVLGLRLVERPWPSWLPPAAEPAPIALEDDARPGVGLVSGAPLTATFVAPARGRLELELGRPPGLGSRGPVRVEVELRAGRARPATRAVLLRTESPPVWHALRVPVGAAAGREVHLTLRAQAKDGGTAVVALAVPRVVVPLEHPPTVLLVTSDTHRADHVGPSDGHPSPTPRIDLLAARGVTFEQCFSSTNITVPSHVAILTGTHPRDTGVLANHVALAQDAPTLAERFAAAGWATWMATSQRALGRPETGLGQGFERMTWPAKSARTAARTIDRLLAWWPDASDRPLFVWLHVFDAHTPYSPPPELRERFWPAGRDPRDPSLPDPPWPVRARDEDPVRDPEWYRAGYRGEVLYLDSELGRVLDLPRVRSGIVAVTGDHGESLGQHGIWWNHAGLYPDTIHVPLVLVWPGAPAGTRVTGPTDQLDLGRTLCDLAGVAAPNFPGRSLVPLEDARPDPPRFALAAAAKAAAITWRGWHLVLGLERDAPGGQAKPGHLPHHGVELYDLTRDPGCTRDLAQAERERARDLRARLVDWLSAPRGAGWSREAAMDAELKSGLEELGYADTLEAPPERELFDPDCDCEHCASWR